MSYYLKLLFGKKEIDKYNSDIELTMLEKEINLKEYIFSYKEETIAFLKGVSEAIGWTEYYSIESKCIGNETRISITTREEFMNFFRDDDLMTLLTADDRIEIFSSVLIGESDFTKELLDQILKDYGVRHLSIVDRTKKRL